LGIARQTENFQNKQIGSLGTCIARKTHSERLLLMIPFINVILNHPGTASVGLTRNGEVLFLRGLHLPQIFLTWASKNLIRGEGVYVCGPSRVILGFGEIILNLPLDKTVINKKMVFFKSELYKKTHAFWEADLLFSKNNLRILSQKLNTKYHQLANWHCVGRDINIIYFNKLK